MKRAKRKLADRVLEGLRQARDHAAGRDVEGLVVHVPETIDVAAIRKRTKLSQVKFARMVAVSVGSLRNWEQGRRQPEGPARVLLAMVERRPEIVIELLGRGFNDTPFPSYNKPRFRRAS